MRDHQYVLNPDKQSHSYEAFLLIDYIRSCLLRKGHKLSFETVMSHPSKIEVLQEARGSGYKNYLYFLATETPEINVELVKLRVKLGGHPVQEEKIKSRYYGSLRQLRLAVSECYRAFIFDNSEVEKRLIVEVFDEDELTFHQLRKFHGG